MVNTKKIINFITKYSINKHILVLNLKDYKYLEKLIDKNYKIDLVRKEKNLRIYNYVNVIANDVYSIHNCSNKYEICVLNDMLEYKNDKEINKIIRVAINNAECFIFDVPVSNFFCDLDHKDIRYLNASYWYNLFNKYDLMIIEEYTYRISFFERHKIFVLRKKEDK